MTTESLKQTFHLPPHGCRQVQAFVSDGSAHGLEQKEIDEVTRTSIMQANPKKQSSRTNQVLQSYDQQMRAAQNGFAPWNVANWTATAAVGVFANVGLTAGLGPVAGPIMAAVVTKGVENYTGQLLQTYKDATSRQIITTTSSQLVKIARTNADDYRAFVDAEGTHFEKARVRLEVMKKHHAFLQDPEIDPTGDDKHKFNTKVSASLAVYGDLTKEVIEELNAQAERDGLYELALEDLDSRMTLEESRVTKLTGEFYNFTKNTNEQLDQLFSDVDHIQTSLGRLNEGIQENTQKIKANRERIEENSLLIKENEETLDFIEEFMYGQMDPSQQIEALKSGKLSHLPNEKKAQMLELAETKQNFMKWQGYAQMASSTLGFLDSVGVDVNPNLRTAVEVGSVALNVGMSLATGNCIGAIGALAGLAGLGKKKADPGAARHKQVMETFSVVIGNQVKMMEGINSIKEFLEGFREEMVANQQAIFEQLIRMEEKIDTVLTNQEKIFERIVQLDEDMKINFKEVMEAIANLSYKVSLGHFNIYYGNNSSTIALEEHLNGMYDNREFDLKANTFTSYDALKNFLGINPNRADTRNEKIMNGLLSLREIMYITSGDSSGTSFHLNNIEAEQHMASRFLEHYRDLRAFVSNIQINPEFSFVSHLYPSTTILELERKLQKQNEPREKWMPDRYNALFRQRELENRPTPNTLLSKPYSHSITYNNVIKAIRLHFLFDVWNADYNLLPLETLSQKTIASRDGKRLLEDTVMRLEILLAQVTFRSGDCYLPYLANIMKQGEGEHFEKLQQLLEQNAVLTHNVVIFGLHKEVLNKEDGLIRYLVAMNHSWDSTQLQELTDTKWNFQHHEKQGWKVHLAGHQILLPSALELQKGTLMLSPEVKQIIGLRKRVIDELLGYSFPHSITNEKTRAIYMASVFSNIKADEVV